MKLRSSGATTVWPFLSSDENQQWHQLRQQQHQALQHLYQQGADGSAQLNLLKQQLVDICSLHRLQQESRTSGF